MRVSFQVVLTFFLLILLLVGCQNDVSVERGRLVGPMKSELAGFVPQGPLFYLAWDGIFDKRGGIAGMMAWEDFVSLSYWEEASRSRQILRLAGWLAEAGESLGYPFGAEDLQKVLASQGALALYEVGAMKMVFLVKIDRQTSYWLDIVKAYSPEESGWYWQQYGNILVLSNDSILFKEVGQIRMGSKKSLLEDPVYRKTVGYLQDDGAILAFMDYEILEEDSYFQRYWIGEPLGSRRVDVRGYGAQIRKEKDGLALQEFHLKNEKKDWVADWQKVLADWEKIWRKRGDGSSVWEIQKGPVMLPGTDYFPQANWCLQAVYPDDPLWGEIIIYNIEAGLSWSEIVDKWRLGLAETLGVEELPIKYLQEGEMVVLDLPFASFAPGLASGGDLLIWGSNREILNKIYGTWPSLADIFLDFDVEIAFWDFKQYEEKQARRTKVWEVMSWPSYQSRNLALNVMGDNREFLGQLSHGSCISFPVSAGIEVRSKLFYR